MKAMLIISFNLNSATDFDFMPQVPTINQAYHVCGNIGSQNFDPCIAFFTMTGSAH
jgi:hypothetical protein